MVVIFMKQKCAIHIRKEAKITHQSQCRGQCGKLFIRKVDKSLTIFVAFLPRSSVSVKQDGVENKAVDP
jgi:hypothetical protein